MRKYRVQYRVLRSMCFIGLLYHYVMTLPQLAKFYDNPPAVAAAAATGRPTCPS